MLIWTVLNLCLILVNSSLPPSSSSDQQAALGQSKYNELSQHSQMPRYGACWTSALNQLPTTCDTLTDDTHSRLALRFTNCLLAQSGQRTYQCGDDEDISQCLEQVDNNAWTSYTNFYTHTHNMCYFLKSQAWKEMTDQTINKLSDTSSLTIEKLEQSHQVQEQIADGQRQSLEYHKQLVENGSVLSQAIEASRGSVRDMMEEFKLSTLEQRNMIFEVFDRVSRLQNLVVSEVSWLYTVVFYSASLLVTYFVTATKRTADARLWLFLWFTINFGAERLMVNMSLPDVEDSRTGATEVGLTEMMNQRVWWLRNATVLVSFLTLVTMALRFKDYNLINNQLLEDIQKQNLEIKRSMEEYKIDNRNSFYNSRTSFYDTLDGQDRDLLRSMLSEDTGFQGDEEENDYDDNSDDSDDSWTSSRSDRTLDRSREASREVTPTPDNDINLAMEQIDSALVMRTPLKNEVPQLSSTLYLPSTSTTTRSRSKSRLSTSSVVSNYNLRRRSSVSQSSGMTPETPATPVRNEVVEKMKNILNRNTNKVNMMNKKQESPRRSETPTSVKKRGRPRKIVQNRLEEYSADEDAL